MKMKDEKNIPQKLILAQDFQKARQYSLSRNLYSEFFSDNPNHPLRFKALFEVTDNWFHEKKYMEALNGFNDFVKYCDAQENLTEEEVGWINAYKQLAVSRLNLVKTRISKEKEVGK